jgi:hypothetical protein
MHRRILVVALPITMITAIGLASIAVGAIGGTSPSGRATAGPGSAACGAVIGTAAGLTPAQELHAATITGVALARGLGPVGAAIGVSVALAESTLFNYANDGTSTLVGSAEGRQLNDSERAVARQSLAFPHDRVGNNLDSIGLFQQRPMTGWGAPAQLIDPATSAGLFFDRLEQVTGWESLPPWQAGQLVQGSPSPDGGIYRDMYEQAVGVVSQLLSPTSAASQPMSMASLAASCAGTAPGDPALAANTPSNGSAQWGGYQNGRIPASALCPVPSRPVLLLECNAAVAFDAMNTAFRAAFGQDIGITDGYRSFGEQVACRAEKGSLCADPGTSNHGWAKAVDIGACCGVNTGTGPAFDWLTSNAARFGWVHPGWAQPGGSKPEPWHWEFGSIS